MPTIAKTVVQNNAYDGHEPKASFCVDGKPFPWWISEEGATAQKLMADLYLVHVNIFCVSTFYHEGLEPSDGGGWAQPVMQGIEFPWYISSDGFTYHSRGGREVPTVELAFLAESVQGMEVTDPNDFLDDGPLFTSFIPDDVA